MIPILYGGTEQDFLSNGLGRLADAITCKVTEERNGSFELEMTYPITGVHYADIAVNRIIMAKTEDGGNNQAFIIYKVSKPLNGVITVNAEHISYLLNGFVVMPFSAVSCADAISKIASNIVINTPFEFYTDVNSIMDFSFSEPRSVRGLLGGEQGSILDTYGGYDYKFDNFNVNLLTDRGADHGVTLRYGKNLTALKDTSDCTNIFTGIVPYWQDSEGNDSVYLPEKVVLSQHASDYPYYIIQSMDFSGDFEEKPTEAQLRARAESYMQSSSGWKIKNNIDVSFVNLAQTEEYKDFVQLERVRMCDTVTVIYDKLGVNVKTKVIKTVYNVLTERYDSISLGDTTYSLAKAIQSAIDTPTLTEVQTDIKSAVNRATKLIQGGLGGHVVFNTNGDGEPQEILIMDTDDITTAVNVIRMNLNGIGFSHNGYSGPFDTAWTIDGHFVADYIDTGELNGGLIKANTISANALTLSTLNDINGIISFIPYDWNTNVNRWEYNARQPHCANGDVDGGYAYYLDLINNISYYDPTYQVQVKSDYVGKAKIHFDIAFNIYGSGTVTVSDQQLMYLWYPDTNGTWHEQEVMRISGTFEKQSGNRDSSKFYKQSADIELAYECDTTKGNPRIGLRFVAGCDFEVFTLKAYSYRGDYIANSLKFNANGLESIVQNGNVISSINQSAETVSINASKIDLTGNLSLRGDFHSYNSNDNTTYAFMNDGQISFYDQGSNVFTIAATAVRGNFAGIFFGDASDPASVQFTSIDQEMVTAPSLYLRSDGSQGTPTGNGDALIEGGIVVHGTSHFYGNVYNAAGTVVFVSDKRKKKSIKDLAIEKAKSFLMALSPRMFKFKEGTSGRYHHGFIAQEVKQAMGVDDWGVYVEDKEQDFIGLRYDEIIADLVAVVQDQEKRIDALERMIHDNSNI